MSNTTKNLQGLIRKDIWSAELKEVLEEQMLAQNFVRLLTEFPDGENFKIPSIGKLTVDNYQEDTAVVYRPVDTGEFNFEITEYLSSATYITKKAQQDAFYAAQLESRFVPMQRDAIMKHFEVNVFEAANRGVAANSTRPIDGVDHRWAASGPGGRLSLADFARARYALKAANVPDTNLVAIVDPSVELDMNIMATGLDVSYNPRWEGLIETGFAGGVSFYRNILGFDVYTSTNLPTITDNALMNKADTPAAVNFAPTSTGGVGKGNLFFSTATDSFIAAWRQMPEVDYEYNKDFQRDEYVTTARYGTALYRPENMVLIASKTNV